MRPLTSFISRTNKGKFSSGDFRFNLRVMVRDASCLLVPDVTGRANSTVVARFFFPNTCNAWSANHLRAIGYKVRAVTRN